MYVFHDLLGIKISKILRTCKNFSPNLNKSNGLMNDTGLIQFEVHG